MTSRPRCTFLNEDDSTCTEEATNITMLTRDGNGAPSCAAHSGMTAYGAREIG